MVVEAGVENFVDNFAVDFEKGDGSVVFDVVLG